MSSRGRRKIMKFVKVAKGVSQVIAVLLMIAIAVIAALVAYFWVNGYFRSTSTKVSKAIQIQSAYYTGQFLGVYVQNVGKGQATLIASQCLYVDGALQGSAHINPGTLEQTAHTCQESETATVVDGISLDLGQTVKIKVVTSEGTFVEKYFTINSFIGSNPYSLLVAVVGQGNVSADNNGPYDYGNVVQLTAHAYAGWAFSYWNGDVSGSANPASIVINGANSVTATFAQNDYVLTLNTVGSGSVSKVPDQATYHYGDSVQLQANAPTGWTFSGWSGDLTGTTNPSSVVIDETPEVTATFTQNTYTLTINTVGQGSVSPNNTGPYYYGDVVELTANPTAGWNFSVWSGDAQGSVNPTTITIDGDKTGTATFTQIEYTLTIGTIGNGAGTVTKTPDQATYHYGDSVQLNAEANTGSFFGGWSGDLSEMTNPVNITIDSNKAVSATFNAATVSGMVVSPPTATITAGGTQAYTATASDAYGNNWDVTGSATWSITIGAGGSWLANVYTSTKAGTWTVTASYSGISGTAQLTVNAGAASKLVYIAGAGQSITRSTYSSVITVQLQDAGGNPISAGAGGVVVSLSTTSSNGRFYLDSAGNNRITSVTIASGASSASFYYSDSSAGSPTLTASSGSLQSATTQFTINSYYLSFHTGGGQTLATGQVSSAISVRRYDYNGNSYYGTTTITVALTTSSSGGHFSANSDGSGAITSVTITSGNRDSSTFYYVDSAVGTPVLTASSAGYTSGQTTFTISSYYLGFRTGGGQTLAAGQVSSGITVRRYNPDGSSYYGTTTITVALTTSSSGGHFSANSDGSGAITSVTITSGNRDSSTFYYVDSAVGTPVLTASSAGYTSGQTTFTIRMPVLVFSAGAPQTLTAGAVSARITVQRQDGSGNAYSPNTAIIVSLASSSGTGVFYSDAAGTLVITQITIASGADHAYIYYKDTAVGSPTLTASSTDHAPATTTFTVYSAGAKLVFTAGTSQTLTRNAVSSVITVQLQDSSGNPILATGDLTVSLSSSSSGGGFYSNAGGSNSITSVTIASGASSANFYYADSSAGSPTLTASSGSLTPATTVFTINSYQLAFSAGAPQTLTAGSVSARITVQRQDRYGNAYAPNTAIIVSLASSSGTGVFYSDAAGTLVITQITIASGADHAYIYYKDTAVGSPALTASTTTAGYTSATTTFTIRMPVLVFSAGAPQTLTAGAVSARITVQRQDGSGNAYSPNTAIIVSLASSSGTGVFYSDAAGTLVITQITIASGADHAYIYYKDTAVGSPTLTASSTGHAPATTTFMILASGAKLVFTAGTGQTLTASTVSSVITVQLQDAGGNPISAGASGVVVSLSTNSSNGRFYSDSAGNNRITSVTIASGTSSANFYYSDSSAGHPILTASSGSLQSATTQFTINSYYLGFRTGGGQTLAAGQVSSSITVRRYQSDGSSYSSGPAITVALTTSSSGGHFSANSDGSGAITSVTITSGSSTSVMFYYVDSAVGTPVLTASSAGYTSGQTTFTITGPASQLVFTAGTSQSLYTNTVSSVITVQRQDAAGYGVTSGGSITIILAKTSTTGSFYANSDGSGGAITQITIASGASSANFYYEDTAAGSSVITASYAGLTSATTTFTITLNQVPNGGFESPAVWTTGGTGYATSQDTDETNIPPHSGIFAELDSAYQTATEYGSLINTFSPAIALSSIPNTAGSLSTWVYNNGHNGVAVGYYSFQIALTASDGTQLIYWWGNTPANAPTETATTKVINMGTLPGMFTVGQWIQFSRNLQADWASKGLSPSTSITSITIRNDGYYSGGNQYGQEIFIDNVQIQ